MADAGAETFGVGMSEPRNMLVIATITEGTVMDLRHIQHELIAGRTGEAWYMLHTAGPSFHYRWQWGSETKVIGEHYSHAVCREEPSLTMSWGMDVNPDDRKLQFDWAKDFVNSDVHAEWVDFYWNGALVDRVQLLSIDGAHGLIPTPDYKMRVSTFELAVAVLIHDLQGSDESDNPVRYIKTIGASEVYDEIRLGAGSSD